MHIEEIKKSPIFSLSKSQIFKMRIYRILKFTGQVQKLNFFHELLLQELDEECHKVIANRARNWMNILVTVTLGKVQGKSLSKSFFFTKKNEAA